MLPAIITYQENRRLLFELRPLAVALSACKQRLEEQHSAQAVGYFREIAHQRIDFRPRQLAADRIGKVDIVVGKRL